MRILALVKSLDHVCNRYRIAAFQTAWEKAGYSVQIQPWSRFFLSGIFARPEIVILQRKLPSPWQALLLKRLAGTLIYDFDDAIFLRDSFSTPGRYSLRRTSHFRMIVKTADHVVAGNAFLAAEAAMLTNSAKISVIPTSVPVNDYGLAKHHRVGEHVQLVWIGSKSTIPCLAGHQDRLEELGRKVPGIRLKIICDQFLEFRHLKTIHCPWKPYTERKELASADIGISLLPDDLWSQGKCGLKVLQYMAAGLPVIANPIGIQRELVTPGVTGFLVSSEQELVTAVDQLANDPELRRRMGQAGRKRVEDSFSTSHSAKLWIQLFDSVGKRPSWSPSQAAS